MYSQGEQAYKATNVLTTDPYKLVLMLYDAALKHLFLARAGVRERNAAKRGEHLSKAIAIISELLSSVSGDPGDEAVAFLRGLYSAMLAELPKVNLTNDMKTIERSIKYCAQLRTIWKDHVMSQGVERTGGAAASALSTTEHAASVRSGAGSAMAATGFSYHG